MISGGLGRWVARSVYLLVSQSSTGGRLGNADLEGNSARVFPRGRGATYMCLKIQLIQFNSNPSRLTPIPNHRSPENSIQIQFNPDPEHPSRCLLEGAFEDKARAL